MASANEAPLREIPVLELGAGHALGLIEAERGRADALIGAAQAHYPGFVINFGDRVSRRWLERNGNPYLDDIHAAAGALGIPGLYFLNVNYEWGCTGAVGAAPSGKGTRLIRVLDWPFDGLGANLVAARIAGPAGEWINLTWPGFVGSIQGLAPGRFAAAFNQAPMRRISSVMVLDWTLERARVWRVGGLPPAHLMRRIFETCANYAAAKAALIETPIATPAIFLLSGPGPGEGCVIERLECQSFVHEQPAAAANHWMSPGLSGRARGDESQTRQAILAGVQADAGEDLAWLEAPVLNETTRLVMIAEPATGRLTVQGFESHGPATLILRLEAAPEAPRLSA